MRSLAIIALAVVIAAAGLLLGAAPARAQVTSAGTTLRNVAMVSYAVADYERLTLTNEVALRVEPPDTRGRIAIARYASAAADVALRAAAGPTQCFTAAGLVTLDAPVQAGVGTLDPATPLPLAETATVHAGDPLFVRVDDADQNSDATVRDVVEVRIRARDTGDTEALRLLETGPDTGVFVGYLPSRLASSDPDSCTLELARDSSLDVNYVDRHNPADTASATGLVDPFGVVFDSTSGEALDGMRVRLVDAAGRPAVVFGDDGTSRYPAEMITGQPVTDAGGTTYRLPRGVYRFPLVASGSYRLVVEPTEGHVFPSGAGVAELQRLPGAPYRLGEGSFGRAFVVAAPVITAVDVPLDPQGSALSLRKAASTEVAAVGDFVAYELVVENGSPRTAIRNVTIADRLPPGVRYRRGSVRVDGQAGTEPTIGDDGQHLSFEIPQLAAGRSLRIRYVTELTVAVQGEELVNTATATATGGVASNEASARVRVRNELFSDRSFIVGRVVAGGCDADPRSAPGVEGVAIYLEDGRYAVTDREGRYHFEGVTPGVHVVQADLASGAGDLQFADCGATTRHAGRRHSQFVDLRAGALWRVDFRLEGPAPTRVAASATAAVTAGSAGAAAPRGAGDDAPRTRPVDFDTLQPGIRFVTPEEGATPAIASLHIAISHFPGQRVALGINGGAVSALNFEGTETDAGRAIAVSRWRGVDLRDGENRVEATIRDSSGTDVATLTRIVHYGGGPVRAEFDREASLLVADGRTRPVVVLRLFDAYGKPARPGTIGAFRVNPPYRSWWEVQALDDNPLLATGAREPTFEVGPGGEARLELEPTTQAGTAVLALRFNERQAQEVRAWLEPAARDWIMVGVATGTAAWKSLSGNATALDESGERIEEGFDGRGRVAFFAKGRVRGDALLTLAYDSARDRRDAQRRLQGVIEPDEYYLLYADGAEPRAEAASAEKLFIKLERRQFVALFGDFETGMTVTELARYNRSLTGLKADFAGDRVGASGFAARTDLGAGRDELRGDGTSGLYRLSRAPLLIGSDKLRIEVRDRFRTERVLSSRELARFLDYRLDYATGELFFKEPVPSRDADFNPVFIVAEYETSGTGEEVTTAGARAALRSEDGRFEVGASLVRDGALAGDTDLAGVDLRWYAGAATEIRAEVARSRSADPTRREEASAYLAELEHVTDRVDAKFYLREQQADFGVGQQLATEAGTRKAGLDLRWKLDPRWSLETELLAQHALETAADRQLAAAAVRYELDGTGVSLGLRHVDDEMPGQGNQRSEQAFMTGAVDVLDRRVTLRAAADASLRGRDESVDYPARTLAGRRLAPARRRRPVCGVGTCRWRRAGVGHDPGRRTRASLGTHAGAVVGQSGADRGRAPQLRELRPHAGIPPDRALDLRPRPRPEQHAARRAHGAAPRAAGATRLGLGDRRLPRDLRRHPVPRRALDPHRTRRATHRRQRRALDVQRRLVSRAVRGPLAVARPAAPRRGPARGSARRAQHRPAFRLGLAAVGLVVDRVQPHRPATRTPRRDAATRSGATLGQQHACQLAVARRPAGRAAARPASRRRHVRRPAPARHVGAGRRRLPDRPAVARLRPRARPRPARRAARVARSRGGAQRGRLRPRHHTVHQRLAVGRLQRGRLRRRRFRRQPQHVPRPVHLGAHQGGSGHFQGFAARQPARATLASRPACRTTTTSSAPKGRWRARCRVSLPGRRRC